MITRLHHAQVTVPTGAEEEARRFYCDFLGLTEVEKPEALKARGGLWLQVGDRQVHVGVEEGVDRSASKAHLAYQVEDLSAWRSRLAGAAVPVLEGVAIPGYDRIELRDPFGNRLELIQRLREPSGDLLDRIAEIEEAAANAWPAGVQQSVDGWRLRFHHGVTRRANSALCPGDGGRLSQEAKVQAVEAFYRRRGLPPRFQITVASLPLALDRYLEDRGYQIPDRTVVMTADAAELAASAPAGGPITGFQESLFPEWLEAYGLSELLTRDRLQARRAILESIGPRTAYFWSDLDTPPQAGHVPPCVALAALEGPLLGMFSMTTRPELRRRGLASAIFRAAAAWGVEQGAETVYLQVSEENTGAITAYEKLGFRPLYHYWYRELDEGAG